MPVEDEQKFELVEHLKLQAELGKEAETDVKTEIEGFKKDLKGMTDSQMKLSQLATLELKLKNGFVNAEDARIEARKIYFS